MKIVSYIHKKEVGIFIATFFIRCIAFLLLLFWYKEFPLVGSDSKSYLEAAEGIVNFGRFLGPDGMPNSYEMPGYPLFLALIHTASHSLLLVSLFQYVLISFAGVLIYKIGSRISERVGLVAALLFAIDPVGVFYSGMIVTEPLFILFLLSAFYCLLKSGESKKYIYTCLSAILLGIATYIRPVGEILIPAFVAHYVFSLKFSWKDFFKKTVVFAVVFLLIVAPWSLRNHILFGTYELSAVASWQFAYAHAPLFYAHENRIPDTEAILIFTHRLSEVSPYKEDVLSNNTGNLRNAPYMWEVAFEYMGQHPFAFTRFHIIKTIPFFFSDGLREAAARIGVIDNEMPNLGNHVLSGNIPGIVDAITENKIIFILFFSGFSFWAFVVFSSLFGFFSVLRDHKEARAIICAAYAIVFLTAAVAGGVVSHPRYRYSISPFLFLVSSFGIDILIKTTRVDGWRNRQYISHYEGSNPLRGEGDEASRGD